MEEKITCVKCGNPECGCDDIFCFNCGAELKNYCTNQECVQNDSDDSELPEDYCFCPLCGSETTFKKNGYIEPKAFA